jgi:hypothetical protein
MSPAIDRPIEPSTGTNPSFVGLLVTAWQRGCGPRRLRQVAGSELGGIVGRTENRVDSSGRTVQGLVPGHGALGCGRGGRSRGANRPAGQPVRAPGRVSGSEVGLHRCSVARHPSGLQRNATEARQCNDATKPGEGSSHEGVSSRIRGVRPRNRCPVRSVAVFPRPGGRFLHPRVRPPSVIGSHRRGPQGLAREDRRVARLLGSAPLSTTGRAVCLRGRIAALQRCTQCVQRCNDCPALNPDTPASSHNTLSATPGMALPTPPRTTADPCSAGWWLPATWTTGSSNFI